MALTDYCDFDEIRAALGVNDEELADAVLALPIYEIGLARELKKISASLPAAFSEASGLPEPPPAPARALLDAVRMFAAYTVARQSGAALSMFAPKDIGDGKASLSRFAGQPYTETMDNVLTNLADARAALVDALAAYSGSGASSSSSLPTFFKASGRGADPVTGS